MFFSRFYTRYLPVLLLTLILVASAYAFAAANVVPESGAGDGDGDISGYTITNIDYTLDTGDPSLLDAVEFDITSTTGNANPPDVVKVQFNAAGAWYNCDATTTPGHADCALGGAVDVVSANNLRVVAAE